MWQVRLLSLLRHPNVAQFMGAVVHPEMVAIVSEFARRRCLYHQIHELKADIDPKKLLEMAKDVARGGLPPEGKRCSKRWVVT